MVALIAYANSFHVPFQLDDVDSMLDKPYVRDIGQFFDFSSPQWSDHGLRMRTVGYFTFALNYLFNGPDVTGYHIVNLSIHIINGLLLYLLVLLSFRTPVLGSSPLKGSAGTIALFVALLFVAHPVQTQAVTYIVQRLASLAALFYLLSFVSYVAWRLSREPETAVSSRRRGWFFYALSIVAAVLAMKTKEIAFTLPVMIALYEFLFMKGDVKKRIVFLIPLLLTLLIIPMGLIGYGKPIGEAIGDVSKVTRVESVMPRWAYLATELRVIVTYVRLLFFPVNQSLDYYYPKFHSFLEPQVFLSFLFLLSIFGVGVYLLYRSRADRTGRHRGVALRLVAFGIFWFFIALSVESSVIPITDVIFEHRLYLPSAGFFMAAVTAVFLIREKLRASHRKAVIAVLCVCIVCLTGLTYSRNGVWHSEASLWGDVVRKYPMDARGHHGLGLAYQREGKLDKAIEQYRIAVRLKPTMAEAHDNLGIVYAMKGELGNAVAEFQLALHSNPLSANAYNNLGTAYVRMGLLDKAIEYYKMAIALKPDDVRYQKFLAEAYEKKKASEANVRK
jgi:tetratricopeptide (TPR) repeat protein